ncbi:unnamed protein product, partial [Cyprideis torosa]
VPPGPAEAPTKAGAVPTAVGAAEGATGGAPTSPPPSSLGTPPHLRQPPITGGYGYGYHMEPPGGPPMSARPPPRPPTGPLSHAHTAPLGVNESGANTASEVDEDVLSVASVQSRLLLHLGFENPWRREAASERERAAEGRAACAGAGRGVLRSAGGDVAAARASEAKISSMRLRKQAVWHSTVKRHTQVARKVADLYHRDDIPCRAEGCASCRPFVEAEKVAHPLLLSSSLAPRTGASSVPSYLLLTPDAVLQGIDVLNDEAFHDIILLQTVLGMVRTASEATYRKLVDLVSDRDRRFVPFLNEFLIATAVEQPIGEGEARYKRRLIRSACAWLASHFAETLSHPVEVLVLLGEDDDCADDLKEALESVKNIRVETLRAFLESLPNGSALSDRLEEKSAMETSATDFSYPEHLSKREIREGVRSGRLRIGRFMGSRENYLEGFVLAEGAEEETGGAQGILVQGLMDLNRAISDDTVAIELYPEAEWRSESGWVEEDNALVLGEEEAETGGEEESVLVEEQGPEVAKVRLEGSTAKRRPTGRVVGIVQRKWREYCGVLEHDGTPNRNICLFRPAERRIPKIRVHSKHASELAGQKLMVSIDSWVRTSRYPSGHIVRSLGSIGDRKTENEVLLIEHDIPHSTFSSAVLECLPRMPWVITEEDRRVRWDLRDREICSVDPPGCTDIDDALHCRILDNGNVEVGVHIADVTHFIRPGTAIDQEAAMRGTTVYLVDNRIDMVPELLSSNLCSLLGKQERFAFSVLWEMKMEDAEVVSVKFGKSIISSRAALTYEAAQLRIDDASDQSELIRGLRRLNQLAKILKRKRLDAGALVLESSEVRFELDSVTREPLDVESKKMRETNSMVEEFMLLANSAVAQKIKDNFPLTAMLRKHPEPPQSNFEPVINAAKAQGFDLDPSSGKALASSLNLAVIPRQPYFNSLLRMLTTRSMMQAVYFAAGTDQDTRHYGLASEIYTHFTSPIRRGKGRMMKSWSPALEIYACIGADQRYPGMTDKDGVQKIANNLNYRHKMAQYAGRASVNLHTHLLFRGKTTAAEAYVFDLRRNAIQLSSVIVCFYEGGVRDVMFDEQDLVLRLPVSDGPQRPDDVSAGVSGCPDPAVFRYCLRLHFLAVSVFIPKYGLEERVMIPADLRESYVVDEVQRTVTIQGITLKCFQAIEVRISMDESNPNRMRLLVQLIEPNIPGLSVPTPPPEKRKESSEANGDSVATKKTRK